MNRLSVEDRARILGCLVEGNSIRATSRLTYAAKGTVLRLLESVGDACDYYLDQNLRNVTCVRIQCDEIWAFCHAKERNIPVQERGEGIGDVWTWIAIDADTKLVVSWHLGKRTSDDANAFVTDLSKRIASFVQISTDGLGMYSEPIQRAFKYRADHGQAVKVFGKDPAENPDTRYSPPVVVEVRKTQVWGAPDPDHISTSFIERKNLTLRMQNRRFTRLTNAFSKKIENLNRSLALHFMYYNFCRKHQTLKTTPAIKAGLTNRVWTLQDLANLPDVLDNALPEVADSN